MLKLIGIHMGAISQRVHKVLFCIKSLKIMLFTFWVNGSPMIVSQFDNKIGSDMNGYYQLMNFVLLPCIVF